MKTMSIGHLSAPRSAVKLLLIVFLIAGLQAAGHECQDLSKPWRCAILALCYSDVERCNGVDDCGDLTDEANCTSVGVTKHLIIYSNRSGQANLAWLVTPVILGIGLLYAIYKCFKEGLCHIRRMQRAQEAHGSYFALDQVSFYSMTPLQRTALGSPGHQLMVVHNHHFSLTMADPLPPPPEDPGGEHEELTPPPTYAEAMNPGISNAGFAPLPQEDPDLPPYKERATPPPPITPPPPPPSTSSQRSRAASFGSVRSQPLSPTARWTPTSPPPVNLRMHPSPLSLHSLSTLSTHSQTPPTCSPCSLPPTSPRLPPPPPSPRRHVSVPTLQQLIQVSTNRIPRTSEQEES